MAVARVHRWLYVSADVRSVSLADYLQTLIGDLDGVSSAPGFASSISLQADPVDVEPDKAVAVGIIATELILNALKHAYPDGTGPVRVRLLHKAPDHAELIVEDEGVGNNKEGSPRMGLGRRIMAGMADKLDGNLTYNCGQSGTRATFSFPLHPRPVHLRQSA
jgi:two-component sensor histidine kinase